jgi:hypothetical protein
MTTTAFDHDNHPGENYAILTPAPVDDVFGFFGTMKSMAGEQAAIQLWDSASLIVSTNFYEDDPAVVRNFLRSCYGRHLADRVTFFANEKDYGDAAKMYEALLSTISETTKHGELFWGQCFEAVRNATLTGEWTD